MIRLTLKSLKIVESEIYNNKLIRYIANIGILLLVFFFAIWRYHMESDRELYNTCLDCYECVPYF